MLERGDDVLAEARRKDVLLRAELVPRLSDDGVDDVQPGDFVFWLALLATEPCQSVRESTSSSAFAKSQRSLEKHLLKGVR